MPVRVSGFVLIRADSLKPTRVTSHIYYMMKAFLISVCFLIGMHCGGCLGDYN